MAETETDHPAKYSIRWFENGHIVLWLLKDLCWVISFKIGGIVMMVPTLLLAFYIAWLSRKNISDRFHNIAVCFWIAANTVWMCSEFYAFEDIGKPIATGLFISGIVTLFIFYGYLNRKISSL